MEPPVISRMCLFPKRDLEIIKKIADGSTGIEIETEYGITQERAHQIFSRFCLDNGFGRVGFKIGRRKILESIDFKKAPVLKDRRNRGVK